MTDDDLPESGADDLAKDPATAAKGKRLTAEQWEEIIRHREYDDLDINQICEKFGVSANAIREKLNRLAKAGRVVEKGSKKHLRAKELEDAVKKEAVEAEARKADTFEGKRRARIERTKEALYRGSQVIEGLQQQIFKEIIDSKGLIKASDRIAEFKALRVANQNLMDMADHRWKLLDVEHDIDEQALPKLVLEDLSAPEIEQLQARSLSEDDDDDEDGLAIDLPEVTT